MYGWLWRRLPGPWPVRALEALVLFVAVCAFLVVVVFPWVEPQLPFSDNVVDGGGTSPDATAPATPGTDVPANDVPSTAPSIDGTSDGGGAGDGGGLPGDG